MANQQPSKFEARVTGRAKYCDIEFRRHYANISRMRFASRVADLLSGQTIKIASSPAMLPTVSGQLSASSAAATGWALPTEVLITRRFWAGRTSNTNSLIRRDAGGSAGSAVC